MCAVNEDLSVGSRVPTECWSVEKQVCSLECEVGFALYGLLSSEILSLLGCSVTLKTMGTLFGPFYRLAPILVSVVVKPSSLVSVVV